MNMSNLEMAKKIADIVSKHNGHTYFVGGYVRDLITGKTNKDIDIEVHGISPFQLKEILDSLGNRIDIGENFGIFGLKGYSLDIAMPRKETNRGSGHKDFDICVDPYIGTYKAAKRRDFTINSMMKNVLTGEIIDHFGGIDDLKNSIIRHVDTNSFIEDPLRVLRAAQFASRFGFNVADETIEICQKMNLTQLPKERIIEEVKKALLNSPKPSVFFEVLRKMNQLSVWFPELENLIGVPQNPKYHAEGDVWVHTMMVLDVSVKFISKVKNKFGFMLAALTHDFGKAVCTQIINEEIHAYNHEKLGLPIIKKFIKRLTNEHQLIKYVINLAEYHMRPNALSADKASIKSTNKMFDSSVDPIGLICIATADNLGRISSKEYIPYDSFLEQRLKIYEEYMSRPYVKGQDLIAAGIVPNKNFSTYLDFAHKLRLSGVDKESALKQTLAIIRKSNNK